eukprot:1142854-Pelagomonas_calceolata.AAC.8
MFTWPVELTACRGFVPACTLDSRMHSAGIPEKSSEYSGKTDVCCADSCSCAKGFLAVKWKDMYTALHNLRSVETVKHEWRLLITS